MKVLFNHRLPFSFAHGGTQTQIQRTKEALEQLGVETDYLRWWDDSQTGDVLHQFGFLPPEVVRLAQNKGWRVVITLLLTETCNRPLWELWLRKLLLRPLMASPVKRHLPWESYRRADHMVVGLEAEKMVLQTVYGVAHQNVSVAPLGLSEAFLQAGKASRSQEYLVCTGTISPNKNSLELARLAVRAKVPILFVGKPYDFQSDYWKQFLQLVDHHWVRHRPHVSSEQQMIEQLKQARGYVLMSRFENWSLAAHEAAACGLPLLLPAQRWARERFGGQAAYIPPNQVQAAAALRRFYDQAPNLPSPQVRLHSWNEVGQEIQRIYSRLIKTPSRG